MDITQDSGSCDGGSIPSGDVNKSSVIYGVDASNRKAKKTD